MGASTRLRTLVMIVFALLVPWSSVAPSSASPVMLERPFERAALASARPGRLVVGLRSSSDLRARGAAMPSLLEQRWGGQLTVRALFDGSAVVVETSSDLTALATRLQRDADVAYVEPDYMYQMSLRPNDEYYGQLYGLPKIGAPAAWDITTGKTSVMVAVVDTGVFAAHPDLRANMVAGANFVYGGNDASDDEGHGTHTAGIIAAVGNNGRGVAGVCWSCKILPVKPLDDEGAGSAVDVSEGIRYAADRGAKVINLSLGGENDSRLLHDSIIYATSRGSLVVAAAGNEAQVGNPIEYPAAYSEVIAVGASDQNDVHAPFSNYGDYLDIAAPGIEIGSTLWYNNEPEPYGIASGTSEAAPFVSGVAALMWSVNPALTVEQVRQTILATADDIGAPGRDPYFGAGRINAYRAVQAAVPQPVVTPTPVVPPAPSPAPGSGDVLTFPETGFTLRGEFRRFWEANGGLPVFGFPISEEQVEQTPEGSFLVQYFERNRFELHPEKAPPYNVLLGRLGDTVLKQNNVDWWSLPKGLPRGGCEFFDTTGHTLCEPFLTYWRKYGLQDSRLAPAGRSLALFGMPLSEPRMETNAAGDTVMTQWFERARFEDHGGKGVLLGLLGNELDTSPAPEPTPVVPQPPTIPNPGVPVPAAMCPDIPPSENGSARPTACLAIGTDMVMDVTGFKPNEQVSFWLTAPNGQVFGGQRTVAVDGAGNLPNQRYATSGLSAGRWYWVFQGIESGQQAVVFYHLYQP